MRVANGLWTITSKHYFHFAGYAGEVFLYVILLHLFDFYSVIEKDY